MAAGERATFTMLDDPQVEMKDLVVNVFGDVAIAAATEDRSRALLVDRPAANASARLI